MHAMTIPAMAPGESFVPLGRHLIPSMFDNCRTQKSQQTAYYWQLSYYCNCNIWCNVTTLVTNTLVKYQTRIRSADYRCVVIDIIDQSKHVHRRCQYFATTTFILPGGYTWIMCIWKFETIIKNSIMLIHNLHDERYFLGAFNSNEDFCWGLT